ncbi:MULTISPECIES: phage antirepressor KilAC domain-containing protein [unclassified Mameliella]|uniref:phage antirepressor KilAC domain-containing protein n=1 Tax=Mameliella sp. LZ-28 TaxID=2484146 RepID=UPI00143F8A2B|nr:phage antirepressor KilAC domain-containing protein [Mameliella sp. LZ-28]MCR9276225.1 phage antirepressor KilAC domain-containing protein [Paracoccaceae bacterium]
MNMIMQSPDQPLTMSSLEIAGLVEKRHDNVKRKIETLAKRGVIDLPQSEEDQIETGHGRKHTVQVYYLEKRDCFVVVAQLSPEFTARIVDRWQELEAEREKRHALPNFSDPVAMARTWADQEEEKRRQAARIEDMSEDVGALKLLSEADGAMTPTNTAKIVKMRPKDFMAWLQRDRWIYRRAGARSFVGYQNRIQSGHLTHKPHPYKDREGFDKVREQVLITPKGLVAIGKKLYKEGLISEVPKPGDQGDLGV